jgi:hypothetical protein
VAGEEGLEDGTEITTVHRFAIAGAAGVELSSVGKFS